MFEYTKEELIALHVARLTELIETAGGASHLAKMLNIPVTTIQGWCRRGRISENGVHLVSLNGGLKGRFSKEYLRPDLK